MSEEHDGEAFPARVVSYADDFAIRSRGGRRPTPFEQLFESIFEGRISGEMANTILTFASLHDVAHAATAPEKAPPKKGRRPKSFVMKLAVFAGLWLDAHGVPDTQAALERTLLDECAKRGWDYSPSQVRELARMAIAELGKFRAD